MEPIKIGTFLSVTGPASFLGDPELRTLRIYIAEMNKGGGVLGRRIELVEYDVDYAAKVLFYLSYHMVGKESE